MPKTRNKKLKRKAISLGTKIEILDRLRNGEGSTFLGKIYGLNEATIRTIKRNENSIRQSVISGTELSAKFSSYTRDATKEKMEKALVIWLENNAKKRISVDGNDIKEQALRFYKMIKDEQPSTSTQSTHEKTYLFSASTGWLTGFLQRHALQTIKIKGGIASEEQKAASSIEFPIKLQKIIADGLELTTKLGYHFVTDDPDFERAAQLHRELGSCLGRYRELYEEVETIGQQRHIAEFTVHNVDADRAGESPVQDYSNDDSDSDPIGIRSKRSRLTDDDDDYV
ncbi:tigger transposable element-derived protein 2-like [Drosophila pseudoobscura]|uniref:Tigger transposable element-derived protein 2-like n=1 Tax=Drosophila pseudoobscura pseudoobscura TaxID=46245 RepID=A0A6I8W0Y2_DROPS|nr:tigger transposable element-derived protein 2-like [Drosophila pseudoobscura]